MWTSVMEREISKCLAIGGRGAGSPRVGVVGWRKNATWACRWRLLSTRPHTCCRGRRCSSDVKRSGFFNVAISNVNIDIETAPLTHDVKPSTAQSGVSTWFCYCTVGLSRLAALVIPQVTPQATRHRQQPWSRGIVCMWHHMCRIKCDVKCAAMVARWKFYSKAEPSKSRTLPRNSWGRPLGAGGS